MATKLEHSNTIPKSYWAILNRLLYNKNIPGISPLFVDGSFMSDYCKKEIFLVTFLFLHAHL